MVQVTGADQAKSDLSSVGKSADSAQQGFGQMLKQGLANAAGFAIFNVGAKAVGFLKDQLTSTITVAMAHQQIMSQTAAVIKSTGDASGFSAQAIGNMALALSKVTPFSDDTIQSGENMLLTFTHIGKTVFPQTTTAMLDMATAMHMGPEQAALQLGKALDDPKTGLTALQREGVKFSASEQESIKTMLAHNDVAGAQTIMLKELQTEFGGSAKAAGQTFAGQLAILKNNLTDVKQEIGGALLPILGQMLGTVSNAVMPVLQGFADWFTKDAIPGLEKFKDKIGEAFTYIGNVLRSTPLMELRDSWNAVSTEFEYSIRKIQTAIGGVLSPVLKSIKTDADPVAEVIGNLARGAVRILSGFLWDLSGAFISVDKQIQAGKGPLIDLGNAFKNIANLMKGELGKEFGDLAKDAKQLGDWFTNSVVPAIKQAMPGFEKLGNVLLNNVAPAVIQIRGVFVDVIQHAFEKFAPIIEKIVPPLIKFAGILANDVANGLKFIMPYIEQAATAIGKFADEIMDRVAPIIKNWIDGLTPLIKAFADWWNANWPAMQHILEGVWNVIVGVVKIAWAIVTGIIKIGLDILGGNWSQAWTDMKDMLGGIWDGIKTVLSGAWDIIKGLFSGWVTDALNAGSNIVKAIANGITGAIQSVKDAIGNVANWISSHLPHSPAKVGPLVDLVKQGGMITEQISQGMLSSMPKLNTTLSQLVKPIAMTFSQGALPSGTTGIPASISGASFAQSNQTTTAYINIDGQRVARALLPAIVSQIRSNVGAWAQ